MCSPLKFTPALAYIITLMRCTYFPLPAARRIQFVSIVQRSVGSVYRNRCFDSSICAHPYAATNISSSLCATSSNRANGDHCWGELAAVRVGDDRPMDNKQRWFAPSRRTANRRRSLASTATVRERTLCCRSREAISRDGEDCFYPPCGSLKAIVRDDSPLAARTIWRQLSQVKYVPVDADFLLLWVGVARRLIDDPNRWRTERFRFARLWRFS